MLELTAIEPNSATIEYYGWAYCGIKIVNLYFKNRTIETITILLFMRFGISRTWTHIRK